MQFRSFPLLALAVACGESPEWASSRPESTQPIVNGTRTPQNTFLTDGEIAALGFLADHRGDEYCSGTLIRPRVVVTAQHCVQGSVASEVFFGFGTQPATYDLLAPVLEIHEHPSIDFAMLILGVEPTEVLAPLTPIDINRAPMGATFRDQWVDAAGFGDTYSSATGRFFASVQIVDWDSETVHVYGHEEQGICYGDSGGPILFQPDAETPPVVVGTEQWGDASCVGNDYLTRLDVVASFVDDVLDDPLPPVLEACGAVDALGECRDGDVVWCENGYLHTKNCAGLNCGWFGDSRGYDCLPYECGDIDYYGACDGTVRSWCAPGRGLQSEDCLDDGLGCAYVDETLGTQCVSCPMCGSNTCVDLDTSTAHCGGCGNSCLPPNGLGQCAAGVCQIASCRAGWLDEDGRVDNGCEKEEGSCAAVPPTPLAALLLLFASLLRFRARSAA